MTTKTEFLDTYRLILPTMYPWAHNREKLDKYMSNVSDTIRDENIKTWNASGDMLRRAWKEIGMKGTPTLKGLRALPD